MKKFAFVNEAAEREYKALPQIIQDEFGKDLRRIQFDQKPTLTLRHLTGVAPGVIELKINGNPAFRCVYATKYFDAVIVLHSFTKTTNGTDINAMNLIRQRLKLLQS